MSTRNNPVLKNRNVVLAVLGALFVGLKLYGVIDWTWPWVTAPFWVILARYLLSLAVTGLVWIYARSMIRSARRREMQERTNPPSRNPRAQPASAASDATLPPYSQAAYSAGDDTSTRSHCSSHSGHGDSGFSSVSDSSCGSSSDGGDSSGSSD